MRKKQTRKVRRSPKVPHRNRNHTGWWIASFIERFEYSDENKANLNRRDVARRVGATVGHPAYVTKTVADLTGAPARSFGDWVAANVDSFRTPGGR
jgi:hypothetical protein